MTWGFKLASVYVGVATVGRSDLTCQTIELLSRQTRKPDGVLVVGVTADDVRGVSQTSVEPEIAFAERGLCRQRNRALELLLGKADIITFFDDDFVPAPEYLSEVEKLFESDPGVAGVTGNLLADGINNQGYTVDEALAIIATRDEIIDARVVKRQALYGCNMSIRVSAAEGLTFDEALPLYGWQEDIDFTYQVGLRGRLVSSTKVTGVHLGTKGGRTSGKKLGYSQVANIVYLKRKGTMQPGLGEKLLTANLLSNIVYSFWSEPHIDRRGRLWGNILALADLLRGNIDPRKIERM